MKSLNPKTVYPGHLARGFPLAGHRDIDYCIRYLRFFRKHIIHHQGKYPPKYIFDLLRDEFPDAVGSMDFLLNRTAENFGTTFSQPKANCKDWMG
jgi:hypothetical protein